MDTNPLCRIIVLIVVLTIRLCRGSFCQENEFECLNRKCIPLTKFCDGFDDCGDYSDEPRRNSSLNYGTKTTFCKSRAGHICILPSSLAPAKSKICSENSSCSADEFECKHGSRCIELHYFCDGVNHCRDDGSDEYNTLTHRVGRMCKVGAHTCVLPGRHFCDGKIDCDDGVDECLCDEISSKYFSNQDCFRCLSHPANVIPAIKLCDGVIDCQDLSDECICKSDARIAICSKIRWESNRRSYFECASGQEGLKKIQLRAICDRRRDCKNNEDELYCNRTEALKKKESNTMANFKCFGGKDATKCDAVPECNNFEDEECKSCTVVPEFCQHVRLLSVRHGFVRCVSNGRIFKEGLCDGKFNCPDGGDERGCGNRFYCTSETIPSIEISKVCDKIDNCENGRDEEACSHFYCHDNGNVKYLDQNKVCDGVRDCVNGSDECQDGCVVSAFSDEESLITSKVILMMVCLVGVGAVTGCITVAVLTAHDVATGNDVSNVNSKKHAMANKILVMSLSISDLLVGIYAVAICIKSLQFQGSYCLFDREWRSSITCSALGAIVIIGSEQSVLTMVWMTTLRLCSFVSPTKNPSIKFIWITVINTWIASILMGCIPIIQSFEDYFVDEVTFENWPLYSSVAREDVEYLNNWLSMMHDQSSFEKHQLLTNWNRLETLVADLNPNYTVAYKFGYYSTHTVCLPTLFPDPKKDFAWKYTLFLLIVNFLSFIYMMVGYSYLYRKVISSNRSSSKEEKSQKELFKRLQIKLTLIVVTDFCCWMPVCIMGFLRMSGVTISTDAYLPTGLLIIPINSALNPFIYSRLSDVLWDRTEPARRRLKSCFASKKQSSNGMDMQDMNQRFDDPECRFIVGDSNYYSEY